MRRPSFPYAALAVLGLALPIAALDAQDLADRPVAPPATVDAPAPAGDNDVAFSADTLAYDDDANIVTVTGDVRMTRQGNRLRADKVVWNRATGAVHAEGNVAITNPQGDVAYSDKVDLTDSLRDGVAENLLLVLEDGGRLAAQHGTRTNGVETLENAAYSPCRVTGPDGCPKTPLWQITAVRVVHDPAKHRISYKDARFSILGATVLWLPSFSHPDGQKFGGGGAGLLLPLVQVSHTNGLEIGLPYYLPLGQNADLTLTPRLYTDVLPSFEAKYRQLTALGAFQVDGIVTYGSRLPATVAPIAGQDRERGLRGYFDANGRLQFDPYWSLTGSFRVASDRTYLRRYNISYDDRLRDVLEAERIDTDSYLSIAGWATQTLRAGDVQGQQPIALPAIDYRRRLEDPWLGGRISLQLNSLAILRTAGQDTQRAFAGAEWDLRRYTRLGQELTLTAYARADVYHTSDVLATAVESYRGDAGWHGRGIAALAADLRWPFVGALFGGTQVLTPRVQLVASPPTRNLAIPNEDARAIDLEDSNLFALNRFAGYDRWEDNSRVTYGVEWAYDRPRLSVRTIFGQSYSLNNRSSIFPIGTGLSERFSDYVGRIVVKYANFVELTHRFRLDKDNLAIRRNEIDLTLGSTKTYLTAGYLRLNRDVDTTLEDLSDREEIRLGGRVQVARHISLFGSTIIDLTGRSEDPLSLSDGYEPVRHRLGILYSDECLDLGVTWRRDYEVIGDARSGNTFSLTLALKNLGR